MYFGCFISVHNEWKHKRDLTIYVQTIFPNPAVQCVENFQIFIKPALFDFA